MAQSGTARAPIRLATTAGFAGSRRWSVDDYVLGSRSPTCHFQRGPPADRSRRASRRVRPTRPVGQTRGVEADITSVPTTGSAFRCVKSEVDGHLRRCPAAGTWVRQNLSQLYVIFSGARIGRRFGLPTGRVHLMAPGKDALVAEVTQVVPERDASALRCHAHSATPWATPARRWTRPMRP
jgi:hypothetical protein